MTYDVAVIGAGPGGYVAAIRCAQNGLKVCIVEKESVGGTCLNKGCIPTKAIITGVKKLDILKSVSDYGIETGSYSLNFDRLMSKKDHTVLQLRKGVAGLLKKNGIDVMKGAAKLVSPNEIRLINNEAVESVVSSKKIIIATGSRPAIPPFFNYDGDNVMTSDDMLELVDVPESLLIIGGGVIGCEFAYIFSTLGSKITMIDQMDNILPNEDEEIVSVLKKIFIKTGITIKTGTSIREMQIHEGSITATMGDGSRLEARKALIAIGRVPNSKNLGLEEQCIVCGACAEVCPAGSLILVGSMMTVDEVAEEAEKDMPFFKRSNGGVTLSGGEPLIQHDFTLALLRRLKADGVSTALESAFNVKWDIIKEALAYTDLFLVDMKVADNRQHQEVTGVSNEIIISNIKSLDETGAGYCIRIPLISGVNDDKISILKIIDILKELKHLQYVEFMPYHSLGEGKYASLGLNLRHIGIKTPEKKLIDELAEQFVCNGIQVK